MRTTLDIDDDILAAAKDLARAEGKTAGKVLSDLARQALTLPAPPGFADQAVAYDGGDWPTLPGRKGRIVTPEQIERIQQQIDREDAIPWDHATDSPREF